MKGFVLFLFITCGLSLEARLPCDGHVNPNAGLTSKEEDLLSLINNVGQKDLSRESLSELSQGIKSYLEQNGVLFDEKKIMIQKEDFGLVPEPFQGSEFEVSMIEIDSNHPVSVHIDKKFPGTKLYYSPELELFRTQSPNQILKYKDGVVLSAKDLYYFEKPIVQTRIEKSLSEALQNYGEIPDPENVVQFTQYLTDVRAHLLQKKVRFTESGEGLDIIFSINPDRKGTTLNKLAFSIHEKFNEASLVYHPHNLKEAKALGMFRSGINTVYISHNSVVTSTVDSVVVHELIHAYINNKLLKQFKFSPFHGRVKPQEGKELSNMTSYKTYMNFEEVATHSLNVHMAAKKMLFGMEGKRVQSEDFHFLLKKTNKAYEIARKASAIMDEGLRKIRGIETFSLDDLTWLHGASGKGFVMDIKTSEYKATIPIYFRDESEEIRSIAAKYIKSDSVVSKSDLKKLKSYLKAIIEERKALYDEVASEHKDLITMLESKKATKKRFLFQDEEMNLLLSKALKGRSTCLSPDFDNSPEVIQSVNFFSRFF
ncbi:MAG: hypothetical protein ACOYL6_09325 [Bacteriovoracaceae bacterium]